MAVDIAVSRVLDKFQILEEWERRKRKFEDRDGWYENLLSYYRNGTIDEGLPILHANAQGRPLLRPIGESIRRDRTYSSKRLTPIVDDYAALIGRMPTARVEPPDDSEQGEERAALLTKYLYSTYEMSRMDYQQAQSGFYLSLLGDSVYVLRPDEATKRVTWEVVSPRHCYPTFFHGYRRFEVYDVLIVERWSYEDLRRQLKVDPDGERDEDCTVMTYISPHQRTMVVGLRSPVMAADALWDLDFCPVVWAFNKVTGQMGMSDIATALDQQDFLDFCLNVWADGIVHMTYPIIGIKNPQSVGQDDLMVGPGSLVELGPEGDIKAVQTQGDPRALEAIIQQTLQDITATTGSSQVRQEGQMKSSITTGRAVQQVQGPQSTRIEFKQQVLGSAIEAANAMTLQLQEKAPLLKKFKGPVYGSHQGRSFRVEFDASRDIDGWYRNRVSWQSLVGMNLQQKVAVAYEGMVAELFDDVRARELIGEEDPIGMRERIANMLRAKARVQQEMMPPEQGGQPPGPQQPQGPQHAPPGFAPRNQMNLNPPGAPGKPIGGPQSTEDRMQPLKAALAKVVTTLKGSVWLLTDGSVAISDSRDYSKVLQALRPVMPGVKVKARSEEGLPGSAIRLA